LSLTSFARRELRVAGRVVFARKPSALCVLPKSVSLLLLTISVRKKKKKKLPKKSWMAGLLF